MSLLPFQVEDIVRLALAEDLALGDITTDALITPSVQAKASVLVKVEGIIAGLPVAEAVFRQVDPSLQFSYLVQDGDRVHPGTIAATITGSAAGILKAERTALNFLQRMSGIATEASHYVAAVTGTNARIIDTRKTAPGLRLLDKYAVRMGGAHNHRQCLGDGILIKDNHLAALDSVGVSLGQAIRCARDGAHHLVKVEVEVENIEQAKQALEAGADIILLDNMSPHEMKRVVELVRGRALTEASGGITLANVRAIAEAGVDLISAGAITHSVKALDISLDFVTL